MAGFRTQFILDALGDIFDRMPAEDRNMLLGIWESWARVLSDQLLVLVQTDLAKSLFTVPVDFRREDIAFTLDDTTRIQDEQRVERGGGVTITALEVTSLVDATRPYFVEVRRDPADVTKTRVRVFTSLADAIAGENITGQTFSLGFGAKVAEPVGGFAGATLTYDYSGRPADGALIKTFPERFAYGIDSEIDSIPELFEKTGIGAHEPLGTPLVEATHYVVSAGALVFLVEPTPFQFAPVLFQNRELIFDNFGFLIDFKQENSRAYRRNVQGLWFAFWNGPTVRNIELGAAIVLGFPISDGGTVLSIDVEIDGSRTIRFRDRNGVIDSASVAAPFVPFIRVKPGDTSDTFFPFVVPFEVVDYIQDRTIDERLAFPEAQKFFQWFILFDADTWVGYIDEFGADGIKLDAVRNFIERIEPRYTRGLIATRRDLEDTFSVASSLDADQEIVDGTERIAQNWVNLLFLAAYQAVNVLTEANYRAGARPDFDLDDGILGLVEHIQVKDFVTLAVLHEEPAP